jgi:hypothetical protein
MNYIWNGEKCCWCDQQYFKDQIELCFINMLVTSVRIGDILTNTRV